MKYKVRNHKDANSAEFVAGCPGDWPRETIIVDDNYKLSSKDTAEKFVVLTSDEVEQIKQTNKQDFISWQNTQEATKKQEISAIRQKAISLHGDLVDIKNNSTNANVAKLAESLLFLIKNTDLNLVD